MTVSSVSDSLAVLLGAVPSAIVSLLEGAAAKSHFTKHMHDSIWTYMHISHYLALQTGCRDHLRGTAMCFTQVSWTGNPSPKNNDAIALYVLAPNVTVDTLSPFKFQWINRSPGAATSGSGSLK